jgi:hypothetical protein
MQSDTAFTSCVSIMSQISKFNRYVTAFLQNQKKA